MTQASGQSRTRRAFAWAFSSGIFSVAVRLATVVGLVWGIVQFLDRFEIKLLPEGIGGVVVFALIAATLFLAVQVVVLVRTRPAVSETAQRGGPEEVFAQSLLVYAKALSLETPRRDSLILQLRGWSGRLLHLMGAVRERTELGQIALASATSLEDRYSQASILIDDVGWSLHKHGDDNAAKENIREGLRICTEEIDGRKQATYYLELKAKGLRHIANIESLHLDLTAARQEFEAPRKISPILTRSLAELNNAQINHSEAEVIARYLDNAVGSSGQVDPSGDYQKLLDEAVVLTEDAEEGFRSAGDSEREAKALHLKVRLFAHDNRKQRYRDAAARLERLEREVARNLH